MSKVRRVVVTSVAAMVLCGTAAAPALAVGQNQVPPSCGVGGAVSSFTQTYDGLGRMGGTYIGDSIQAAHAVEFSYCK